MLSTQSNEYDYLALLQYYELSLRFSRNLIQADEPKVALKLAQNHLESLELSGYIRFLRGSTQGIARFGTNVNRDFLRNVDEIKSTLTSTHRIVIEDDFVVAKSDLCFIYICRKEHEIISIDILEDTLSAFLETLNTWLENYLSKRDVSNVLQCSLIDLIESSQNLVNCHQKASEDLLKTLSSNFPQLGLKTHQEERILELVQKEQREHIDLIESQIKKNNGLVDMLIASVDALR